MCGVYSRGAALLRLLPVGGRRRSGCLINQCMADASSSRNLCFYYIVAGYLLQIKVNAWKGAKVCSYSLYTDVQPPHFVHAAGRQLDDIFLFSSYPSVHRQFP